MLTPRCSPAAAVAKRHQYSAFAGPRGINDLGGFFFGVAILSMVGALGGIESFLLASPLPSALPTLRIANNFRDCGLPVDRPHCGQRSRAIAYECPQACRQKHRPPSSTSRVILHASEDDTTAGGGIPRVMESIGLVSQPFVWISLYSVATTGHGLPAGPGGLIGGLEGVAYLAVVALALLPKGGIDDGETSSIDVRTLSRISMGLGLTVLAGVAASEGCIPNAKPILDYSAYFPVCGPGP